MTCNKEQVTQAFIESREDVYRYLLTLRVPPALAQDATQEAFLRLYLALERGDEISNRRAWIFRVAHNQALDLLAKERFQPLEETLEMTLRDGGRLAETQLIERERVERLANAWSTLSPQQKHCLHLRTEGLRYREIAETLQISTSSVREFLDRAIGRLRKAVHE